VTLNALTPSGTLDFNYVKPYGNVVIDLYKGLSYKMAWNYYGFNVKGVQNPSGLATIPMQDFNGSTATFAFRYAFLRAQSKRTGAVLANSRRKNK
jgi:hypothetical protein